MKRLENVIGFAILAILLTFGQLVFKDQFYRLVLGLGFGYALARGYFGFAGGVNLAYRKGSTRLAVVLAIMFLATTAVTTAFAFKNPDMINHIHPINMGLVVGGLLFGIGMAFCSCCATGSLTDLSMGFTRAIITVVFMCIGVFLGFYFQGNKSPSFNWVNESIVKVGGRNGVFMPDMFKWDGFNGFLGATVITGVLAGILILVANKYQNKREDEGTLFDVGREEVKKDIRGKEHGLYDRLFVIPWRMSTAAAVIIAFFAILTGITGKGWGATTAFGLWFGNILNILGVPSDTLASFTHRSAKYFSGAFFAHPVSVQNLGIIVAPFIYLLTAGKFRKSFVAEIKIKWSEVPLFAIGGFIMGFGTRLSNGCNVGALYSPIANFSLSGWVYLIFVAAGSIIGNRIYIGKIAKCDASPTHYTT